MQDYNEEMFALPISGHYDCGYGYGMQQSSSAPVAVPMPVRSRNASSGHIARPSHLSRPRSPPMVLPNSFLASQANSSRQNSVESIPVSCLMQEAPPPVPPKSWARPCSDETNKLTYNDSDSEQSISSTKSRQTSTQSMQTNVSSSSSVSQDRIINTDTKIKPDPLPSHSNPQWLSPSQLAAFSGPRPIQPMQLRRREVCDSYSGERIYQLSDETRLKLSRQAIYQIYEPGSSSIVGTLGYPTDSSTDIAVILRGQDVVLKRESPTSNRWCFRQSNPIKKSTFWYWSKDRLRGDIILSDTRKGGVAIARIQKDVLSFERSGLGLDTVNEICLTAMALAELARRSPLYEDAPNLASAIAIIAMGESSDEISSPEEVFVKPKRKLTLTMR